MAIRRYTPLLLTAILLTPTSSSWSAQTKFSLERLCQRADVIVIGQVKKLEYSVQNWPRVGKITFTDVTLQVEEVWKGKVEGQEFVVRVPGGRNSDGSILHVSETPKFVVGERALVFSRPYLGRPWVYGWEQGKYRVVVKRVVGKPAFAIDKDVMTYALRRRVDAILAAASRKKQDADSGHPPRDKKGG